MIPRPPNSSASAQLWFSFRYVIGRGTYGSFDSESLLLRARKITSIIDELTEVPFGLNL